MNVLKIAATAACLSAAVASIPTSRAAPIDYPTDALADYVFGCMASNGQTQDSLRRCSCSIDVVASIIQIYLCLILKEMNLQVLAAHRVAL